MALLGSLLRKSQVFTEHLLADFWFQKANYLDLLSESGIDSKLKQTLGIRPRLPPAWWGGIESGEMVKAETSPITGSPFFAPILSLRSPEGCDVTGHLWPFPRKSHSGLEARSQKRTVSSLQLLRPRVPARFRRSLLWLLHRSHHSCPLWRVDTERKQADLVTIPRKGKRGWNWPWTSSAQ